MIIINAGDRVKAANYNEEESPYRPGTVQECIPGNDGEYSYEVELDNGQIVIVTKYYIEKL